MNERFWGVRAPVAINRLAGRCAVRPDPLSQRRQARARVPSARVSAIVASYARVHCTLALATRTHTHTELWDGEGDFRTHASAATSGSASLALPALAMQVL